MTFMPFTYEDFKLKTEIRNKKLMLDIEHQKAIRNLWWARHILRLDTSIIWEPIETNRAMYCTGYDVAW